MKTENEIMVRPILAEKVIELLIKQITPGPSMTFKCYPDAIIEDIFIDKECCYGILDKYAFNKKVQKVYFCQISIEEKIDDSSSRIRPNVFCFPIPESDFKKILGPEITLREFMSGRYNYNGRIIKNMRDFIEIVNS